MCKVCRTLLNDDTLKQFLIQGFVKAGSIKGVLERILRTLAEAKVAARDMEHINRDYEILWRREDELIFQFIPLLPRSGVEPIRPLNQSSYVSIEAVPLSLAVREPIPLLALPAPRVDPQIEKVEQRLCATQLGFQDAMMKQFKSHTNQMSLLIKNQQHGHLFQIKSGNHSSGFWCTQCQ